MDLLFILASLKQGTLKALKQIEDIKYSEELLSCGVKNIIKLAIVFRWQEIKITQGNS